MTDERRVYQRLRLTKPILAMFAGGSALVLDIGVSGALIEHHGSATPGDVFNLSFRWQAADVEFECKVARTEVARKATGIVSHTGVRFVKAVGESQARLQELMATFVGRVLAEQKANAAGADRDTAPTLLEQLGGARRSRSHGYISYRLKGDSWWRVPTASPAQPADGFTMAAHEEDEEVETLCRTYERADEEGRNLIRLIAELSAMESKA